MLEGTKYTDTPALTGMDEENMQMTEIIVDVSKYTDESIPKFVNDPSFEMSEQTKNSESRVNTGGPIYEPGDVRWDG